MGPAGQEHHTNPHEEKILLVLTLIIGAVVGLVVVAFIVVTENLGSKLYPAGGAAWRRLLIPFAGALGTGFLLFRYFPNARGSGIPQAKTALFLRDGYISFRTVLGKFGLCSVSLASGIALGREGPSVHVGAGIASVVGRRLGLSPAGVRALLPVGASAALAAAFNTPIAAVLFSLEEVMGDMHAPVLGSIVLSSATSWIVLHLVLGDEPLFHVPAYQLVHPLEFLFYAVLGLVGGLVSVAFVKALLWQRQRFLALPKWTQWMQPAAGGLTVGILGWFFPDVLGVGYGIVGKALNGQIAIGVMALLVCLKIVATSTCYASGNAGGIFGPSLFMGAMMGGTVGGLAHLLAPDYTGSVGAYALVGMGAAFAGVVRVPLTSVIMIFEITRDYSIIVPLMIANLLSYYISSRLQEEPIYEALQHQDGVHLPSGARARDVLLTVAHAMRPATSVLSAGETVERVLETVDREQGAWPVVDAAGLRGMLTLEQLERAARDGSATLGSLLPEPQAADHLTFEHFPHLHPDHSLDYAMRRLAASQPKVLPVVSRTAIRELKGMVSLGDVVAAYRIGERVDPAPVPLAAAAQSSRKLLARVTAALIAVAIVTAFLNYFYRTERTARATRDYQAGEDLARHERYEEAVVRFREALSISHSPQHRLALGLALADSGRLPEASLYLNEVLRSDPGNGPANRGMARVYAQQGNIDAAVLHYQRAAYGSWPEKAEENRSRTRLELVDALRKAGRAEQAVAELRAAVQAGPTDPAAHESLARAEFDLGDYAAARDAWRDALRLEPSDANAARQIQLCDRLLALSPRLPGLSMDEQERRWRAILAGIVDEIAGCGAPDNDDVRAARAVAAPALEDLSSRLWTYRLKSCASPPAADDPIVRLMR